MSGRSGGAPRGCSNPSLQPLRATVPFQLQRGSAPLYREPKAVDKTAARPPRPTIRRTLSLDTIVGPYLQGQWPREAEAACVNDKATQLLWDRCVRQVWASASLKAVELVAVCWLSRKRRVPLKDSVLLDRGDPGKEERGWAQALSVLGKCRALEGESVKLEPKSVLSPFRPQVAKVRHHLQKRSRNAPPSAGYELPHGTLPAGQAAGVTQTVPMMPLNRLAPRLRRSVEGLSLELEEVFVSEKPDDEHEILDIPDGHRAPVPAQRCSSGSQSEPSPSLPSPSLSPCPLDSSLPSGSPCHLDASRLSPSPPPCPMLDPEPAECEGLCSSSSASLPSFALEAPLQQPCSSSPRPNKTYTFQRVPPEGCERIRVCEEAMSACPDEQLLQPSCPDPNKVNFTPHGGSAFCPVSLLKPLLPSMDLLFRSLSVSPVTGCSGQASPTRHLGMQ